MTVGSEMLAQMCEIPEPQGTDEELVREALKSFRRLALSFRYGGLGYQCELSRAALAAFERLVDPQASFLRWANQPHHDVDEFYQDEEELR